MSAEARARRLLREWERTTAFIPTANPMNALRDLLAEHEDLVLAARRAVDHLQDRYGSWVADDERNEAREIMRTLRRALGERGGS